MCWALQICNWPWPELLIPNPPAGVAGGVVPTMVSETPFPLTLSDEGFFFCHLKAVCVRTLLPAALLLSFATVCLPSLGSGLLVTSAQFLWVWRVNGDMPSSCPAPGQPACASQKLLRNWQQRFLEHFYCCGPSFSLMGLPRAAQVTFSVRMYVWKYVQMDGWTDEWMKVWWMDG